MFEKILSYWRYGATYCSVELTNINNQQKVFVVTSEKKNDEFVVSQTFELNSIADLPDKLKKNQHVFLTINNDQVLIKEIQYFESVQKAVSHAFPGLKTSDFYCELLKGDGKNFISICRKKYIDKLLREIENLNVEVLGVHLGFLSFSNLIPVIGNGTIISSRHNLTVTNSLLGTFENRTDFKDKNYTIDNTVISSNYMLALAGLFNYSVESDDLSSNFSTRRKNLKVRHSQRVFFRKGIRVALGILLVTLTINFVLYNILYKKRRVWREEIQIYSDQKERFDMQLSRVKSKEKVVDNILNNRNSKSSFFLNRIVAIKPESVIFRKFEYQPIVGSIRTNKKIDLKKNTIIISGENENNESFNRWITSLESLAWTKEVVVNEYALSKNDISTFEISITIKKDDVLP